MFEFGGLWKHKSNQQALVPPKTEVLPLQWRNAEKQKMSMEKKVFYLVFYGKLCMLSQWGFFWFGFGGSYLFSLHICDKLNDFLSMHVSLTFGTEFHPIHTCLHAHTCTHTHNHIQLYACRHIIYFIFYVYTHTCLQLTQ